MEPTRPAREEGLGLVRDWMSRNPVTVEVERTVGQVVHLMRARGIRHVLVMDGERLAGIVSNRDVRSLPIEDEPRVLSGSLVTQVMSEHPVTVSPEARLTDAAREMLDRKIGALPVVEGDRPIGILTKSDALEALLTWAERVRGARLG
jgi:CBS domain-containing protein